MMSYWIVTADERVGRLARVERTPAGGVRVVIDDEIHRSGEEHEHGRPSPRRGRDGHSYASYGHETETTRDRFAKEIAVWLEQRDESLQFERIALFAPPRFLGALREAWSPRFAIRVNERQGDLTHLAPADLARQAAIMDLVGVARRRP